MNPHRPARPSAPLRHAPGSRLLLAPLLTAAVLAMSACGIVPKKVEIAIFDPTPTLQADPAWPMAPGQLVVQRPNADTLLDSARIVVRPQPGELQVYRGAAWAQPAPDLVQDAIVRLLEDSERIAGVSRRGGGIAGDHDLTLDIRRFDADYAGQDTPGAVVEISASLIDNQHNRIIGHRLFRATRPAEGTDLANVSAALRDALGSTSQEIVGWTLQTLSREPVPPTTPPAQR
ncbi:ABC-type transport auxiliary lipoprotein family protein [Luteimonas sp. e5]